MLVRRRLDEATVRDLPASCLACRWAAPIGTETSRQGCEPGGPDPTRFEPRGSAPNGSFGGSEEMEPPVVEAPDNVELVESLVHGWGSPGWLLARGPDVVGHVVYGPVPLLPPEYRAPGPSGSVSVDAVLLVSLAVQDRRHGRRAQAELVRAMFEDCARRGVRAVEAYALRRPRGDGERAGHCRPVLDVLTRLGFAVVQDHPTLPRVRADVSRALTWPSAHEAMRRIVIGLSASAGGPDSDPVAGHGAPQEIAEGQTIPEVQSPTTRFLPNKCWKVSWTP